MNRILVYGLTCIFLLLAFSTQATTIILPTDEQLVEKASLIVDGTVVSSIPVERDGAIWTETVVEVARSMKGRAEGRITIREIGGELETRITKIFGTPEFTVGERVMLFLEQHPRGGYRTVDLFLGKFSEARMANGRRLWMREDGADVTLLDAAFHEVERRNVQRDAIGFETFVGDRVAGRQGKKDYGIENPVLDLQDSTSTGGGRIESNFTLIAEPTVYRWTRFDTGGTASWVSAGQQPGYSNGGVSELQTAMASWNNYSQASINYAYSGTRSGTLGGLDRANGANEVLFNDPLNEISGTFTGSGVVGTGGFNGVTSGPTWTAPFAADASHPAGSMRTTTITEGNLVIQDGVTASNMSSSRLAEIIAHEFGHTLGFGHSASSSALMFRSVTGQGPSLRSDDQLAARWLYPNGSSEPTPTPQPPAAPTNLRATVSASNVDLAWDDNASNETGQSIYRSTNNAAFTKVADLGANVESARVSGLPSGSHRFYVVATNAAGASAQSNTVTATIAAGPSARFSLTPQSGNAGTTSFTFFDESTGTVSSRQWNFGDGATSTAAVATHVYANPGTYTVTLTVSGNGVSSQASKNVQVFGTLNANFVFSPTNPTPNANVTFTDQSTGAPTAWNWDFGDGTSSNSQNPTKRYAAVGTYSVRLTVSRSGSGSSSETKTITVSTTTPVTPTVVAAFSASTMSTTPGQSVVFTDQSTGSPTKWSWSFGDGATSSSRNPSHAFAAPGIYTVTLTASNSASTSTTSKQISVNQTAAYRSLISVAAQTGGVGGTSWRTELTVFNAGSQGANVRLLFLPAGGGQPVTRDVFLAPRQSQTYGNALLDLFNIPSGAGAVGIEASSAGTNADLRLTSRTFTTGATGTYGQSVPDVEPAQLASTLYIAGIKSNADFRTNIGLVNRASTPVDTTLTLFSPTGGTTSTKSMKLPANSFQQFALFGLFPEVEGRSFSSMSMRLVSAAADAVSAYASVVDSITQDPVYVQAVPAAKGGSLTIPVVGRAPGANNTFWRSDVTFFNPTPSRMSLTLRYAGATQNFTVDGGDTRVLEDVLLGFGHTSGTGALSVSWSTSTGPVVTSRTYTSVQNGGTFGQSIDPLASLSNQVFVPGLRNDASYRTNVGFVNAGNETERFTVIALSQSGNEIARDTVTLAPGAQTQSALTALLPLSHGNYTLLVQGDGNAQLFAYGSMIDNLSGDPVFYAGH